MGDAPPPGHPLRFSTLAHAGCTILGPMLPAELDAVVAEAVELSGGPRPRVLDVGCGKGDLLVRFAQCGVRGIGLDRNPWFISDASALAAGAGVAELLALRTVDAATAPLPQGSDVVACVGATGALGGPEAAPGVIASLLRPGGIAVIGEGFWLTQPPPGMAEDFGIGPDELVDLEASIGRIAAGGLNPVTVHVAGLAGWDKYEDAYAGAIERWAAANDGDPDRAAYIQRAAMMRETWTRWRREAMGFAVVLARRPAP